MQITKELLREKRPCTDGYRDFCEHFPDGVEYQELLDYCCEHDRADYAYWLLDAFGAMDDVRKIEGDYTTDRAIVVAGSLAVSGSIEAGESIKAGCGIEAGWGIKAGWDYGVYAGLHCKLSSDLRIVRAPQKPQNLMCGKWVGVDEQ